MTGDQFDPYVFNDYENANLALILQVEEEMGSGAAYPSVNYTGSYIDGTGEYYNHVVMLQDGNTVSYEWYTGDEYRYGEDGLQINEDGSINGDYWNFWFEDDGTLSVQMVEEYAMLPKTFWRVP